VYIRPEKKAAVQTHACLSEMQPHLPRPSTSAEQANNGQVNPSIQLYTSTASLNDGLPCSHGAEDELNPSELVRHCCESFGKFFGSSKIKVIFLIKQKAQKTRIDNQFLLRNFVESVCF
jgi:hypothetical protein